MDRIQFHFTTNNCSKKFLHNEVGNLETKIISQCSRIGIRKSFMNFFMYKTDLILVYKNYVQNINMSSNDSLFKILLGRFIQDPS